ncbi:hypothetical protein Cni_G21707 [Canna indica]|uniref:Uncharacterized protein n=1 Tax=Canna indica TaxID=4628 RepID=A0AAQ3KTL4_9LILI|nr:hypothetical protein Cni_G21707 [Canna indica]
MGPECVGAHLNDAPDGIPPVPPGFSSLTSFTLKRVEEDVMASTDASSGLCTLPDEKPRKSLQYSPWVNYRDFINCTDKESDSQYFEQDVPSNSCLPKGVLRGCSECETCQKVTARWRPKDASKITLDEAPVFHPSEEEFKNTLEYIASIRPNAEQYGICRIVPPASWRPTCLLEEKNVWENSIFNTRIQQVHKLQNRNSSKIKRNHSDMRRKKQKLLKMTGNSNDIMLEAHHFRYHYSSESFGFEPGPDFTLESFQKYADGFKEQYFQTNVGFDITCRQKEPSVENIEGEYWRIVEKPTEEIEVLYGADLDTSDFGSGFPKASSFSQNLEFEDQHFRSGWNLNNLAQLPGSLLSFESGKIPGILVPWLYTGMCFSSFCWHVEDHHLYSLNYLHCGAPKIWYGVPGKDALKFEDAMKKYLPDLFDEQPDLLHNLVTQFSPSLLTLEGVPVYRCVQYSGEFVLTFPRAYHSGFSCGFNCAEAVNVAPLDWLPHGQNVVELYREQARKISISHDKLLLGAAREAVRDMWNESFLRENTSGNSRWINFCRSDGIFVKALEARIEMERIRREYLCSSQSQKMDGGFDVKNERECFLCHYDLHLSAASCPCSPDRFACMIHAKDLCSCSWSTRTFLFRYDISELSTLLDALSGKLSAIHKWGNFDLGLSLSSYISKEKKGKFKLSVPTNGEGNDQNGNEEPCHRMNESFQPSVSKILSMTSSSYCQNTDIFTDNSSNLKILDADQVEEVCSRDLSSLRDKQLVELLTDKESQCLKSAAEPSADALPAKEASDCAATSIHHQIPQHSGSGKAFVDSKDRETSINSEYDLDRENFAASSFCAERNLSQYNHQQEGSQLVVQRINRNVEVLAYGIVLSGKLWSTSQAIFPKGYKSRVKYLSILVPTQMCYYISEILDAGLLGPLFMVMVEQCPSEVFVHVSASKCWDMVRERANHEIQKLSNLGTLNLPSLQPPGSVDGLEMFGLSSPTIIQAIEALDYHHVCTDYWRSRPNTPAIPVHPRQASTKLAVRGLFKKANHEELHALQSLLNNDLTSKSCEEIIQLLNEEIHSRVS